VYGQGVNVDTNTSAGKMRRNEKNGRLKTLAKFDTIGLKEGFFKMDCKKEVKYAPSVKVYM